MENWRLSRIEEELGKLNLDSDVARFSTVSSKDSYSNCLKQSDVKAQSDDDDDDISSKIIIRPAYKRMSKGKIEPSKAAQVIKEKYDSLNAVTKSTVSSEILLPSEEIPLFGVCLPEVKVQHTTRNRNTSQIDNNYSTIAPEPTVVTASIAQNRSAPFVTVQPENPAQPGERISLISNSPRKSSQTDVNESSSISNPMTPPAISNECSSRTFHQDVSSVRAKPPTAAKPFPNLSRAQPPVTTRLSQDNNSNTCQVLYATIEKRSLEPPSPELKSVKDLFNDLPPVHPIPSPPTTFPDPPPSFFLPDSTPMRVSLPQNGRTVKDDYERHELISTAESCKPVTLVMSGNGLYHPDCSLPVQNSGSLEPRCEYIATETQNIQHLANSYNASYPRYGTLKAKSTSRHPNSPTSEVRCDLYPPGGLSLTEEDHNQVEMFYRSHKTQVFASRCEANLYFGSARRHSTAVPSRAKSEGSARATETPENSENWLFYKCGIPVLVLDSGESRRQRRLHIILAERGSGFVLWRDTVDYLTNYCMSADAAFHTMHLSKDHTKLAGLFFSDALLATEFYDYLNSLTSDPDDPLLNLSAGSRRKKDRRMGRTQSKKEKRKPIRREDISMPCCFTHVTKLDRNDGLQLLEAEQLLMEQ